MNAGAFWTTNAQNHAQSIEYYTDTATAETFSELGWARTFARQANLADELVFIADGAHWIWRIVHRHFPNAIQMVDWFHASSYLLKIANAAFGEGNSPAKAWLASVPSALYEGLLGSVIRHYRNVAALASNPVAEARSYFAYNRTRLRYTKFRQMGLQIGFGSDGKRLQTNRP